MKFDWSSIDPTKSSSLMVLYAVALHVVWAIAIWSDPVAVNGTALHALFMVFGESQHVLFWALLTVAACAAFGAFWKFNWSGMLLMPQQMLLLVSASGALSAMWLGHFSDGVVRAPEFIVADQIHVVLTAVGHTIALVAHFQKEGL